MKSLLLFLIFSSPLLNFSSVSKPIVALSELRQLEVFPLNMYYGTAAEDYFVLMSATQDEGFTLSGTT